MKFKLSEGMKVKVLRTLHGGHFPVGTIGIARNCKNGVVCKLEANGDWWMYQTDELAPIRTRPKKHLTRASISTSGRLRTANVFHNGYDFKIHYTVTKGKVSGVSLAN
jgi:hypothetical protein